jgi:tripartite-type tricarboxylate transporter receptor subunit TctC
MPTAQQRSSTPAHRRITAPFTHPRIRETSMARIHVNANQGKTAQPVTEVLRATTATRRAATVAVMSLVATLAAPGLAHAQAWPSKPVTLVVPFPAGGTTDVLARALAERLQPVLGQTVIVESKPGAGATLGADFVAKSRADGHTLLVGAVHHTIATSVYKKLPYDLQRDFAPLTVIAMVPNVLTVSASTNIKSVAELVAQAKGAKPEFSYGSNGNGTAQHLIGTQFQNLTGTSLLHIPYKGSGPLTTDLLGGQVNMSFDTITPVLPHIKAGKLRALAVTTGRRSSALPGVPTLAESGLKDFDLGTWFGVFAPVGTPKDVQAKLATEMIKIIQSPEFKKRMDDIGAEPIGNTPEQMARQVKDETERLAKLVKQAGVSID